MTTNLALYKTLRAADRNKMRYAEIEGRKAYITMSQVDFLRVYQPTMNNEESFNAQQRRVDMFYWTMERFAGSKCKEFEAIQNYLDLLTKHGNVRSAAERVLMDYFLIDVRSHKVVKSCILSEQEIKDLVRQMKAQGYNSFTNGYHSIENRRATPAERQALMSLAKDKELDLVTALLNVKTK